MNSLDDTGSAVVLLLGGARSGKSALAEQVASKFEDVAYIATAEAIDDEMRERIKRHREARPDSWHTFEVNGSILDTAEKALDLAKVLIIDCLTVYVARRMEKTTDDDEIVSEILEVVEIAKRSDKVALFVSNEVGLGLVPEYPVGRRYRDLLGKVNQQLASQSDYVYFVIAGIPVEIKALGGAIALETAVGACSGSNVAQVRGGCGA